MVSADFVEYMGWIVFSSAYTNVQAKPLVAERLLLCFSSSMGLFFAFIMISSAGHVLLSNAHWGLIHDTKVSLCAIDSRQLIRNEESLLFYPSKLHGADNNHGGRV